MISFSIKPLLNAASTGNSWKKNLGELFNSKWAKDFKD